MSVSDEKERQEKFPWNRSEFHSEYNAYLARYKVESCLKYIKGSSLLDIACGDGLMTNMFSSRFENIVGVDANGAHLEKARQRLPSAKFYESLIEDLSNDEKFDTILMLDLLEHVKDPVGVLKKAASFLR